MIGLLQNSKVLPFVPNQGGPQVLTQVLTNAGVQQGLGRVFILEGPRSSDINTLFIGNSKKLYWVNSKNYIVQILSFGANQDDLQVLT